MNKEIVFVSKVMNGGVARVISLLVNELVKLGNQVTLIISHQKYTDAKLDLIESNIKTISLEDEIHHTYRIRKKLKMLNARFYHKVGICNSEEKYLIEKYKVRNYEKIRYLKEFFSQHPRATAVAFLYDSIYLTLLSARKTNRVIISERGDPQQCLSSRTNLAFFKTMFEKADDMVFQSPDAMQWYRDNTNVRGKIIFNPVKPDLPERYVGERNKRIVNFCRISPPKKLDTLIEAFDIFANTYADYELYFYGDADSAESDYINFVKATIDSAIHKKRIHLLPAKQDIHSEILNYSMFVSSSYFEGMSNSMLEAMAIGLPTICTDCPAGGARAVIKDHENGILVPVNDAQSMADAMKEVAGNPELAEKLSINGTKIREELSVDKIVNKWMEIIND